MNPFGAGRPNRIGSDGGYLVIGTPDGWTTPGPASRTTGVTSEVPVGVARQVPAGHTRRQGEQPHATTAGTSR